MKSNALRPDEHLDGVALQYSSCRMQTLCADFVLIQPQYFSCRRAVIRLPTARTIFLRSLVFIIVVMMFAERGPSKSRHDFAEKQIKKDHSAYSSTPADNHGAEHPPPH